MQQRSLTHSYAYGTLVLLLGEMDEGSIYFRLLALVEEYIYVRGKQGRSTAMRYANISTHCCVLYKGTIFIENCKPFERIEKRRNAGLGKWDERIPVHVSRPVMKCQWLRKKNLL